MVKELERAGIPAVLICSLVSIAQSVGANRIVPGLGIPHPLGDPASNPDEEKRQRKALVERGLKALVTPIAEQTVF
jgi:glycine/betaine/sarcosine/D-proline reductase family selenoprotein B